MALSTMRVCVPQKRQELCPPRRNLCPGGCKPGFCLNAYCIYNSRPEIMYGRPEVDREAEFRQQDEEIAIEEQRRMKMKAFLENEKRQMGMTEFERDQSRTAIDFQPEIDLNQMKTKTVRKNMRPPARLSCMLNFPTVSGSSDDYSDFSFFLRSTTMPFYHRDDTITEYRDSHNMAVWNNRKELDRQIYKLKRDWLSLWGELNVKEQRCKKAWQEKLAEDSVKK